MSNEAAAVLENISLSFGKGKQKTPALNDISLRIEKGGITGLLGPDAAGKTTLLRALAGLLLPDCGQISIFGQTPQNLRAKSPNSIGYMPQRFGLYEDLSVWDNLELYAKLRGLSRDEREKTFARLLRFTSLGPFTKRLAGNLSGGMKQKLGIACSLLGDPALLLLDEPGVGVDPRSRLDLWQMVGELVKNGMTVVWSTAYLDEAAKCPNLLVLEKGSLLFDGPPQELAAKSRGNVYALSKKADAKARRAALAFWSSEPGIVDVMIEGDFIRLEAGGEDAKTARQAIAQAGGSLAPPSLEAAWLAAVGGIDKRPSPFAALPPRNCDHQKPVIAAKNLIRKFGDFVAANDISLTVAPGEIVGLLGPNGAGKSTTFRMLCGLLAPTSGQCFVNDADMFKSGSAARVNLGYMAQKFSLYQDISVWNNIYISGRLYGLSRKRIKDFGLVMADALDLGPWLSRHAGSLPLGLKQRLALLCATLHEPAALFLDEPTSGVDLRGRRDFWKHISALASLGTAILVTTHFLEEAEYCDRIALIYRGNMIEYGPPQKLRAQSATLEEAFIARIDRYDSENPA